MPREWEMGPPKADKDKGKVRVSSKGYNAADQANGFGVDVEVDKITFVFTGGRKEEVPVESVGRAPTEKA